MYWKVKSFSYDLQQYENLQEEVALLKSLRHENIVR